ncbi:MAG TPA: tripartite tricarboxylate transporter substrate binding protein, partial [Gemmatimonadales bacterium]|nr:tripartite tricarboxylate transporter substrate binding protein [Gemmatimonadales bacterium]
APWPSQPLMLVAPNPPGGFTDLVARIVGSELGKSLGQPVVVENKAGAATMIGTTFVANAKPDGYTLLMGSNSGMTVNPAVYSKPLAYDPVKSFEPIGMVASAGLVLVVNPATPVKDLAELVQLAKAKPGSLSFASWGTGSVSHLAAEMFRAGAGIDLIHVPFKGGEPAKVAVLGGQVTMAFDNIFASTSQIHAGKLRALAVSSLQRDRGLAHVPSLAELGYKDFEVLAWVGLFAPAGTPKQIVERLSRELQSILARPDIREQLIARGAEPRGSSGAAMLEYMKAERDRFSRTVKMAGIKIGDP